MYQTHANPRILVSSFANFMSIRYIGEISDQTLNLKSLYFCFFVFCFVFLFKNNYKNTNTQRNCEMSPSGVCPKSMLLDPMGLNFLFFSFLFLNKWFLENFITSLLILKSNGIYPEIF